MIERIEHPFAPIFDAGSRVLLLGTMPSPKSRAVQFYYGHPQNRFWRILPEIFSEGLLVSVDEKTDFLHRHHIALWDVLSSCEIKGADDSSIRNAKPNNLQMIFALCQIRAVFTNGQKASDCYRKYFGNNFSVPHISLPSTSPANCRNWTYETLRDAYRIITEFTD